MYRIGTLGWLVIAVVVILVLVWITHSTYTKGYMPDGVFKDTYESMIASAYRSYDKWIESPSNLWTKTVGYENDEAVQLAMTKAMKLEEMHHSNSNNLNVTAADAAENSFILAELNRYNVAPNADPAEQLQALDMADIMYRRTLSRMRNNPMTVARNNDHVEAILERIGEFDDITGNNTDPLRPIVEETRQHIRHARVEIAREPKPKSKPKGKAAYYEPKPIRNDPQNVHDTELTHDLKIKYNRIVEKNNRDANNIGLRNYRQPTIADVRVDLNAARLPETTRENASTVLTTITNGGAVTALGTTEDKILLEVWKRINSPDNEENRDELKRSLWTSMASGVETNYNGNSATVCTVGRCSRILDSLTLMDSDKHIAKPPQTVEVLRNEVLSKSYVVLQNALRNSPLAAVYNGTEPETDDNRQALDDFKLSVKREIADTIHKDYPDAKPDTLNNIIQDAQAGVDI